MFILGDINRYEIGSTCGVESVTLTIGQMPRHSCYNGILNKLRSYTGDVTTIAVNNVNSASQPDLIYGQIEGIEEPHIHLPPYTTLKVCQKTTEDEVDLSQYVQLQDFNILYKEFSYLPSFDDFASTNDPNSFASPDFVYQNFLTKQDIQALYVLKSVITSMDNVVFQNQMIQQDDLLKYALRQDLPVLPNFENFVQQIINETKREQKIETYKEQIQELQQQIKLQTKIQN